MQATQPLPSPTQAEATATHVRRESKRGFFFLAARTLLLHGLQAVSVLCLARWLIPKDYGTYSILNGWVSASWYFCDIGIAGALVQSARPPTERQLGLCFAVQMGLSTTFAVAFWVLAPTLVAYHSLPETAVWMIRVLGLTVPVYASRGVVRVLMDRNLTFVRSGSIELAETFVMYVAQIALAGIGFGAWSFIAGNAIRSTVGSALFLRSQPQFYRPNLSWSELKPLLRFGLSFQANALVPALRGLIVPIVLGSLLAVDQVGLISWVSGLAAIPSVLAMNYNQVIFPSLSRLQSERDAMLKMAGRSTDLALLGFAYLFGLAACTSMPLVELLFSSRWQNARPLLPLAILAFGLSTIRYLGAAVLNAAGHPNHRLRIELLTLASEFTASWVIVAHFGAPGYFWLLSAINCVALALTIHSLAEFLPARSAKRFLAVITGATLGYFACSRLKPFGLPPLLQLTACVILFHAAYFGVSGYLESGIWKDLVWLLREGPIVSRLRGGSKQ